MIETTNRKLRIQIAVYHELVAEMIGESHAEIDLFWTRWVNSRIDSGYDPGGSIIQLADMPRAWDVPVGSDVRHERYLKFGRK